MRGSGSHLASLLAVLLYCVLHLWLRLGALMQRSFFATQSSAVACNIMEEFHHFTDLDIGQSVPRLSARGHTALEFQQQFVARNKPVVLTDAVEHWPALKLWSANYLTQRVGDVKVLPCMLAVRSWTLAGDALVSSRLLRRSQLR